MATVKQLQSKYEPLTEAEAKVVVRREDEAKENGQDVDIDQLVAQVKSERIGPAATWEPKPEVVSSFSSAPQADDDQEEDSPSEFEPAEPQADDDQEEGS